MSVEKTAAVEALKAVLAALLTNKPTSNIINVRHLIPGFEPEFILAFVAGGNGAKYSRKEDGSDWITIFVPTTPTPKTLRDLLLARKSSFVHEFIHLLDYRDVDPAEVVIPGASDKEQFTHPAEIKAYMGQGLYAVEDAIENTPKKDFTRKFGSSFTAFAKTALSMFHPLFLKHADPEVKQQIIDELKAIYDHAVAQQQVSLYELVFNAGKDQDWPANGGVVMFAAKESYKPEGSTHDGISHAIKHAGEFFPAEVASILASYRAQIEKDKNLNIKTYGGNSVDPKKVSSYLELDGTIENTLDRINDKVKNNKPLTDEEKIGYAAALKMYELYKALADRLVATSVPVDKVTSKKEVENIILSGKPIRFTGTFRGHDHTYVFDLATRGFVSIRDDGKINTLFKQEKNIGAYINSLGSIQNRFVSDALMGL